MKGTEYTELFPTQIKKVNCTIPVSAWSSSKRINFTVNGVLDDESAQFIKIDVNADSYTEWVSCGILCIGQSANSLRISCTDKPKNPMSFVVTIIPLKQGMIRSDDSDYQFKTKLKEKQTNGAYVMYEPLILASEQVTLFADRWATELGGTRTRISLPSGLSMESDSMFIYPVPAFASLSGYISSNVTCEALNGQLNFYCDTTPEDDLLVYVVYGGVKN